MKSYVDYPPRKLQSESYTGPITIPQFERFQHIREELKKRGFNIPLPSGN
jgi:arylsulfatase